MSDADGCKSRQQRFVDLMSGQRTGVGACLLRGLAGAGACGYRGIIGLRNAGYRVHLLPARRLGRPVVSVGNITVGGTGKTVLVAEVARWLIDAGCRPAVLMRGYKGNDSPVGSDEAALLRRQFPGVAVEADPDRVAGGRRLLAADAPPDCFILDDGFQHRRLHRDLDVVALDATFDLGGPLARMLPRGLLREPVKSIGRADAVVITRADQAPPEMLERLADLVRRVAPSLPIAQCRHAPTGVDMDGQSQPLATLAGRRYLAFCGIGNPAAFAATVKRLPGECVDFVAFDDHHAYADDELNALAARAARVGADLLLTTTKDRVKITAAPMPLAALQVGIAWIGDGESLREAVLRVAGAVK
ncbi:MAG: Tetraacyldisaccharide 4'-kinase [Phycisphaerae bacterium]|nr:Tetraacyldisaccharide 4'-kinase [Phycisphaerae bacterium]